jgi:hypothetical protein
MRTVASRYILVILATLCASISYGQKPLSPKQEAAIDDFQARVRAYAKLREEVLGRVPKIPEKATKEQIQVFRDSFQRAMRAARAGSKHGDVITPQAAEAIRYLIATTYVGKDRIRLRAAVYEAENRTVPVRANSVYPDAVEILETPPKLLKVLPQLPNEIRYRFVTGTLLLMDSYNHLIIDYMTKAIP